MKLKDAAKERKIMDVTLAIVHEKGMMGVKMSEVARKVGISPSNLYIYFKDKEDLLQSVFFDTIIRVTESLDLDRIIAEQPIYKKRIFTIFRMFVLKKVETIQELSFVQQFFQSPYFHKEYVPKMDQITKGLFDIFRVGQENMILKDRVELELIISLIDGMTTKLAHLHHGGKIKLDEAMIERSFTLVWDAIRQ